MLGAILLTTAIGGLTYFVFRGRTPRRSRRSRRPALAPLEETDSSEDSPPTTEEPWHPDLEEVSWSDQLYISPDFQEVRQGGVWNAETKHPRVIEEAKAAGPGNVGNTKDVLNGLVEDASPEAMAAGYDQWGPRLQKWYDGWAEHIEADLLIYAENPDFLT